MSTTFLARSKTTLPTAEHTDTPAAPAVVGSATSATVATEPSALRRVVSALGVLGPGGTIAAAILLVVAIAAIWPSLLTSTDPLAANPLNTLQPPSAEHIAGTDSLGRDVLTRIRRAHHWRVRSAPSYEAPRWPLGRPACSGAASNGAVHQSETRV